MERRRVALRWNLRFGFLTCWFHRILDTYFPSGMASVHPLIKSKMLTISGDHRCLQDLELPGQRFLADVQLPDYFVSRKQCWHRAVQLLSLICQRWCTLHTLSSGSLKLFHCRHCTLQFKGTAVHCHVHCTLQQTVHVPPYLIHKPFGVNSANRSGEGQALSAWMEYIEWPRVGTKYTKQFSPYLETPDNCECQLWHISNLILSCCDWQ